MVAYGPTSYDAFSTIEYVGDTVVLRINHEAIDEEAAEMMKSAVIDAHELYNANRILVCLKGKKVSVRVFAAIDEARQALGEWVRIACSLDDDQCRIFKMLPMSRRITAMSDELAVLAALGPER